jgi:hypothetical protein
VVAGRLEGGWHGDAYATGAKRRHWSRLLVVVVVLLAAEIECAERGPDSCGANDGAGLRLVLPRLLL